MPLRCPPSIASWLRGQVQVFPYTVREVAGPLPSGVGPPADLVTYCTASYALGTAGRTYIDLPKQRADGDGLAVLGRDLAEHTGGRRRHFDGDLVGLELDQRLVHRDGVAGFLEPAADGCFRHGLAERRNTNFSHGIFPLCVMTGLVPAIHASKQSRTKGRGCPEHLGRRRRFAPLTRA